MCGHVGFNPVKFEHVVFTPVMCGHIVFTPVMCGNVVFTRLIVADLSIDGVADTRVVVCGAGAPVTLVDVQTSWAETIRD